ncbi:MAG: metalloregulator ArsR/SmtB family transcription factor [Planctomycetota bacterium]
MTKHEPNILPAGPDQIVDRLSALGDGVRLRILRVLEAEELSVGEVGDVLQLPQSTVSRHLKILAEGGWLAKRSSGPASYYRLFRDDLDAHSRTLWAAVHAQFGSSATLQEDDRRLRDVLASRRTDSLAFFGRVAGEWDQYRRELFGERFDAAALLGLLPPSWTVADLGCGTGDLSEALAPRVDRVIAVDMSEPMLNAARRRLSGATNIEFREGALGRLPLEDRSIDAACCSLVLHHIADPQRAMSDIARVLRPENGGGVLLVIDMLPHDRQEFRRTMGHEHLGFGAEEIDRLFIGSGFRPARFVELRAEPGSKGPGLFAAAGWLAPS